jgi:DNA-binding transcriptional LysR family regulator
VLVEHGEAMDLAKLTHFLAVADHGHYGRAAEEIGISQQALSASIARLEEEYGVRLFERGRFGASLTRYGVALQRYARAMVGEASLARAEIETLRGGGTGSLCIGAGLGFSNFLVPGAITRFLHLWPDYDLRCHVDSTPNLYQRLAQGGLDLVISAPAVGLAPEPGIERETLFLQRDVLGARPGHPLASQPDAAFADFARYTWIASAAQAGGWERTQAIFAANGAEPPLRVVRTDSTDLAISLLLGSDMLCILAESVISHPLGEGQLTIIEAPALIDQRLAYLAKRRRGSLGAGATAFIRAFREEAEAYGFHVGSPGQFALGPMTGPTIGPTTVPAPTAPVFSTRGG